MDFGAFKDWALLGILGGACAYAGVQIRTLVQSVSTLNVQMAETLVHMRAHSRRLDEHGDRLNRLEDKV